MRLHRLALAGAIAGACLNSGALHAQDSEATARALDDTVPPSRKRQTIVRLQVGVSYSEGDYGQPDKTEVLFVPVSLRLTHGPWRARIYASYISIAGPATVIDGELNNVPAGTPGSATRSGFGDIKLMIGRRFDLTDTLRLNGDVRLKLPTASEAKRLTTGTTDVTVRAELVQRIGDVSLRAGGRRRFAGGDGRVVVQDTWGAHAGASVDLGDGLVAGADYSWLESSYGNAPNSSAIAWISVPLNRRLRLTGYGGAGFTSNSADVTLGTSLSIRFD